MDHQYSVWGGAARNECMLEKRMNRENAKAPHASLTDESVGPTLPPGDLQGGGRRAQRAPRLPSDFSQLLTERLVPLAAIGSVLAAAGCCLPIFPFVVAAGFAGFSAFLNAARPYLLGASVLFLAFGFYRRRRAKQCRRKPSATGAALLWVSTAFVTLSIFFPQLMANAAANLLDFHGSPVPAGQRPLEWLTPQTLAGIKERFNAAKDHVRVLLLLSPT